MSCIRFLDDPNSLGIEGKAIQLYLDNDPLLVVFNGRGRYHAHALEDVLREAGVPFETEMRDLKDPVPLLRGERYAVVGMSMAFCNGSLLYLSGDSGTYGLGPSHEHLNEVVDAEYEVELIDPGL